MKPPKFKRGDTVYYMWSYNDIFSGTIYQVTQETDHEQKEEGVFYKVESWCYRLAETGYELYERQLFGSLKEAEVEKKREQKEIDDYFNSLEK